MPTYLPTNMGSMMNFLIDKTHHKERQVDILNADNHEKTPVSKARVSVNKYENLFKQDTMIPKSILDTNETLTVKGLIETARDHTDKLTEQLKQRELTLRIQTRDKVKRTTSSMSLEHNIHRQISRHDVSIPTLDMELK